MRHILLPLLEREFNPNIKQALAQTATLTAEDADCLNELAEEKFLQYVLQDDHSCSCDTAWLLSLPAALCSRIIRMMWKNAWSCRSAYLSADAAGDRLGA